MASVGTLSIAKLFKDTEYGKAYINYWEDHCKQYGGLGRANEYTLAVNFNNFDQDNPKLMEIVQQIAAERELDIVLTTEKVKILLEEVFHQNKIIFETLSVQNKTIFWWSQKIDITEEVSNRFMASM